MKKFLLAMLMLSVFTLSAQTTVTASHFRNGIWNSVTRQYDCSEWKDVSISFAFTATEIIVGDRAKSVYTFTSDRRVYKGDAKDNVTFTSYTWNCHDEKYRPCKFSITYYSDGASKISIFYKDDNIVLNYGISE